MSYNNNNPNINQINDYHRCTPEETQNRVYHANTNIFHYHGSNPNNHVPPYYQTPHYRQNIPPHVLPSNIPGLPRNYPFHPQTNTSVSPYSSISQQPSLQEVAHPTSTPILNTSLVSLSSTTDDSIKKKKYKNKGIEGETR